jgi:hypothetical protein
MNLLVFSPGKSAQHDLGFAFKCLKDVRIMHVGSLSTAGVFIQQRTYNAMVIYSVGNEAANLELAKKALAYKMPVIWVFSKVNPCVKLGCNDFQAFTIATFAQDVEGKIMSLVS